MAISNAKIRTTFTSARMKRAVSKVNQHLPTVMHHITQIADKEIKTDYLIRGGTFTPKKAEGYKWVKNPSRWLRLGTGDLRRSWRALAVIKKGNQWIGQLVTTSAYARIHEYGGDTGRGHKTHLRKRSYIQPMMRDNRARFRAMLGKTVKAVLQ